MSGTPVVLRCGVCRRQYLGRRQCCDAKCDPAPIRRGCVAESARPGQDVSIRIILVGGPRLDQARRAIAGLLKAPPKIPFELVLVASRLSEAMCRYIRHVARRENVRLLLVPPGARRSSWRAADRAARAAGGRLLVFARAGIRGYPPGVWGTIETALTDHRAGLAGMGPVWRQTLAEPSAVSSDPRYRFSMVPLNDSVVAMGSEVFREVGGFRGTGSRGGTLLDPQYRIIRANYRLALAKVPAGSARFGRHRPDPRFVRHRYPVFSVAIATRNYGGWLPGCLDSVLRCENPTGAPV